MLSTCLMFWYSGDKSNDGGSVSAVRRGGDAAARLGDVWRSGPGERSGGLGEEGSVLVRPCHLRHDLDSWRRCQRRSPAEEAGVAGTGTGDAAGQKDGQKRSGPKAQRGTGEGQRGKGAVGQKRQGYRTQKGGPKAQWVKSAEGHRPQGQRGKGAVGQKRQGDRRLKGGPKAQWAKSSKGPEGQRGKGANKGDRRAKGQRGKVQGARGTGAKVEGGVL